MIRQGLQLRLVGVTATFGALAALVLIIVFLVRVSSPRGTGTGETEEVLSRVGPARVVDDEEIADVVAAALIFIGSLASRSNGLGGVGGGVRAVVGGERASVR